jgi:hypothetical protein
MAKKGAAATLQKGAKKASKAVVKKRSTHEGPTIPIASRGLQIAHMKMFEPACPELVKMEINLTRNNGMAHAGLRYVPAPAQPPVVPAHAHVCPIGPYVLPRTYGAENTLLTLSLSLSVFRAPARHSHFTHERLPSFKYHNQSTAFEVVNPKPDPVTRMHDASHVNLFFAEGAPVRVDTAGLDSTEVYAKLLAAARGTERGAKHPSPPAPELPAPVRIVMKMDKAGAVTFNDDATRAPDALYDTLPAEYAMILRRQVAAIRAKVAEDKEKDK